MKQTKKQFTFSNFNLKIEPDRITENELSINKLFNIKLSNKIIEPLSNFESIFREIFNDKYDDIYNKNKTIIDSLINVRIFENFDKYSLTYNYRIFAITENFSLYEYLIADETFKNYGIQFSSEPKYIFCKNNLYVHDNLGSFVMINGSSYPIILTNLPLIQTFANYNSNLFFSVKDNPFSIYFTIDNSQIENLSSSLEQYQMIELNSSMGKVLKLTIYKNELYIIQEFGISKLYLNSLSQYKILNYCTINSRIYQETIKNNDDYIIFMTTAGLYIFDGNDIKKVFVDEIKTFVGKPIKAVTFNNKYYLLTEFINSENNEDSLLYELNFDENSINIYSTGKINDIFIIKSSKIYSINILKKQALNEKIFKLDYNNKTNEFKYIRFNDINFGNLNQKILNSIKVFGSGNYNITIKSNFNNITFQSDGNLNISNIGLKGDIFQIEIKSKYNFSIKSIGISIISSEENYD